LRPRDAHASRRDPVYAVDLWFDVLVRDDGVTHGAYDHDDFEEAIRYGWLSEREVAGALRGLRDLVDLIGWGELVRFLAHLHPFGAGRVPAAPDVLRMALDEIPLLPPGRRPSW
jgi:hypothetical protein